MSRADKRSAATTKDGEAATQYELLLHIAQTTSRDELLDLLEVELRTLLAPDGYLINLIDEAQRKLHCERIALPPGHKSMEATLQGLSFDLAGSDANAAAFVGRTAVLLDAAGQAGYRATVSGKLKGWGVESGVVLPLALAGQSVGTVMLLRLAGNWRDDELAHAQARVRLFVPQLVLLGELEAIRQRERSLGHWLAEQQRFLDFVVEVGSLSEVGEVYQRIAAEFLKRHPFDLVGFLRPQGGHLHLREVIARDGAVTAAMPAELVAHYAEHPFWLGSADGATPLAFVQNSDFYFPDVQEVLHLPMSDKDRTGLQIMRTPRTFFIVPLLHRGEPIGVLWLMSLSERCALSREARRLIKSLCAFLGTAIINAELYAQTAQQWEEVSDQYLHLREKVRELDDLALRDRLTGLINFGGFEQELERRVAEDERADGDSQLSLLVIDVDHFKRFNDTHGHAAGNEVLQALAQRLRRVVRKMDVSCRYGGEEFVVILPRCDIEGALILGERVRFDVESQPLHGAEAVTVSIGCACRRRGESAQALFERADQALYRAKRRGRNRVES